ncbi:MAG: flagellar protein FlaG [Deltaproteobacteria bacterium]|nr:flagellar protein FlaG [Deltaproteobacteria bacterium]
MDAQSTVITVEDGRAVSSVKSSPTITRDHDVAAATSRFNSHRDDANGVVEEDSDAVRVALGTNSASENSNVESVEQGSSSPRESSQTDKSAEQTLNEAKELSSELTDLISPKSVRFTKDDEGKFQFEVVDENGEIIRQFPPEKVLEMRDSLRENGGIGLVKEIA